MVGGRDFRHEPAGIGPFRTIRGDLYDRLALEFNGWIGDLDEPPTRHRRRFAGRMHGEVQSCLGGGDDQDGTVGACGTRVNGGT